MLIVLYINVWYAYLHLPYKKQPNVGKYTIHWVFGTLFHMQDTISRHASPMPRQKNCWVAFIHIPICMIFASSRNAARGLKNGKFDVSLWKKIYRNGIWGGKRLNLEHWTSFCCRNSVIVLVFLWSVQVFCMCSHCSAHFKCYSVVDGSKFCTRGVG